MFRVCLAARVWIKHVLSYPHGEYEDWVRWHFLVQRWITSSDELVDLNLQPEDVHI